MQQQQQQQVVKAVDANSAQTAQLCDHIVIYLQSAKKRQVARKERKSPLDSGLFALIWRLVSYLELGSFDKRILLTTPSHLQSLQSLISELFKSLFCQKALSLFKKSEFSGKSWLSVLKRESQQKLHEMQLHEIEQLLDKHLYGDLSSSRRVSPSLRDRRQTNLPIYDENGAVIADKDLYEVLVDLAIYIIIKLAGGSIMSQAGPKEFSFDQVDSSGDLLAHLVSSFVKHIRDHETLSQRQQNSQLNPQQGKKAPTKKAALRDESIKSDILTCLPSALTFLKLLQHSKRIHEVAKEKEVANKLFGVLPKLFQLEEDTSGIMKNLNDKRRQLDLNQLIVSHGRLNNNHGTNAPGTAGRPQQNMADPMINTGGGGAITMESGRSNTLRVFQNSPKKSVSPAKNQLSANNLNSSSILTKQQVAAEDPDRSRFRKKTAGNFRANSEPPNEIGLYNIHSQDDLKATKELAGTFKGDEHQKLLQLNMNQAVIAQSATRNRNIQKVPPILVNKIQNMNMVSAGPNAQNNFQSTNSSLVMNNFFNMPHGQLYQTTNTAQGSAHNPPQGADKTSQYKFVSQPTLAKSRLTRRQQSITKTSGNLSSNNLLGKIQAAQPTQSVNLTNLGGVTNAVQPIRESSAGPPKPNINPYKDAVEETIGSKRSASQRPKIPALNFTKVLKQSGAESRQNPAAAHSSFSNAISPFQGTAGAITNSMLPSAVSTHKFMNAQQATSISNNAFIANNFLMPVASCQSILGHTRSSRSPVSAKATNVLQATNPEKQQQQQVQGVRETESIFDDVNGSFHLADGPDANALECINAEEKLQNLAIQLGESCLTHDLAALMSQKRDLELVESARKIVQQRPSIRRQWTHQMGVGVQRSVSHNPQKLGGSSAFSGDLGEAFGRLRGGASKGTPSQLSTESLRNQKKSLVRRANEILNSNKVQNRQQQRLRYRVVLMNIAETLLLAVSNEEARFVRQPINLLTSYLESAYFREQREKKQINKLQKGIKLGSKPHLSEQQLDHQGYLKVLFGEANGITQDASDIEMFIMQNDGQTCKLTQLIQTTGTDGQAALPAYDDGMSIGSSVLLTDGRHTNTIQASNAPNCFSPKQSQREKQLAQKQSVLLEARDVFKAICLPEVKVVTRLLCKFQFVNEDVLRSQVLNELESFTTRDRNGESRLLASLLSTPNANFNGSHPLHNHLNSSQLGLPNSGYNMSPSKLLQANSFDLDHQQEILTEQGGVNGARNTKVAAHQTLQHAQCFWSTNGIAYEVFQSSSGHSLKQTSAALVSRESIRMKLDQLLYSVNRRIRFIFQQGFDITDYQFSDALVVQIVILNAYLEEHRSRTVLHQVIEVCLESLLMVKKALIDISLNTNILVMDFTRNMNFNDLLISAKGTSAEVRGNGAETEYDSMGLKAKLLLRQQRLRDLFSEFLYLCGILLKTPQSADTLKLLNETLIYDEMWQEGIKTFVIALFLSDLVGPVTAQDLNHFQRQQLEDLRGVNIVNFDQSVYFNSIMQLRESKLYQLARDSVHRSLLAAQKILTYLKAVAKFYESAIQQYFPQTFDQQTQQKAEQSRTPQHANVATGQPYSNFGFIPGMPTPQMKQGKDEALGAIADAQKQEAEKQRNQKYWKHVIRKVLYQLMFLITQPNGLFYQYLQNNATSYSTMARHEVRKFSRTQNLVEDNSSPKPQQNNAGGVTYQQQATPMNLLLTKSMLSFMQRIFTLPERFTKYVFDEELLLFYIRTTYISFVKLYNKNFSITQQVQDAMAEDTSANAASAEEQQLNQKHREIRKQASLALCKKLLKCLFAIARNRNEDTRRKMFQFKIVQFLLQEIGLEFEVQQRREKFIKLSKEQQMVPETPEQQQPAKATPVAQAPDKTQDQVFQPKVPVKFKIPALKTAGLGLSTLMDANGKTQEEKDVENLVSQNGTQQKMVPALEIKGKVIAVEVPKGVNFGDQVERIVEETQAPPQQQPQPVKKKPFIPPLLGAKNLGMSTLMNENGKTQEELDVEATVKQNQQQMAPKPVQARAPTTPSVLSNTQQSEGQQPKPVKKRPFIPPLLGAKNLGMSTLVQANGKTQEEMDVDNLVKGVQQTQPPAPVPQIQEQPLPVKKKLPFIPPLTGAKNLGMSTLIQDNGKTMEEMDVENLVKGGGPPMEQEKPRIPMALQQQQPDPPTRKMPFIPPLLGAKNLGMSTLVQANGKTQEEMDVDNLVKGVQQPMSMPQPPQVQEQPAPVKKKPFIPPLLGAKNLGMSTLIQANGKTLEEMDVESMIKPSNSGYQGPRIVSPPIEEEKRDEVSIDGENDSEAQMTDDSEVRRRFNIGTMQQQVPISSQVPDQTPNTRYGAANNDGEGSTDSDESYYAELERIKSKIQAAEQEPLHPKNAGLNAPNQRFVPILAVKNLGLSTLQGEGQAKTAEELHVDQLIEESKGPSRIAMTHKMADQSASFGIQGPSVNQLVMNLKQNSATDDMNSNQSLGQPQAQNFQLSVEETDASKRSKLRNSQKRGLIRQSRSNLRRNVETEEARSKAVTRNHAYQSDAADPMMSPQNVISGFHESSHINTIIHQSTDQYQKNAVVGMQLGLGSVATSKDLLSPPSQKSHPAIANDKTSSERSKSANSQGSHIGRNKVFVPHLSFPEDINEDPREKRTVHAKPADDARFNLKKSSGAGATTTLGAGGKKAYGKKSKLLDFNIQGASSEVEPKARQLQDEPVSEDPMLAARGSRADETEPHQRDSVQSNKIKQINLLQQQMQSQAPPMAQQQQQQDYDRPPINRASQDTADPAKQGLSQMEVSEEVFYLKERSVRLIYQDDELHVLMLSLMMCLLLKPERGTLDELYCSQFPIHDDNQNILYLLHWHLSHPHNQQIVPGLLKRMEMVSPPLAGIRLLKLMCPSLFDISLYNDGKGWNKLAAGQYGIVYECQTKFARPQSVAIKQMSLPQSISDRCVLHDIFTEITCLEEFRLEPCVTDLFDYGVDQTSYYIVMKKYSGSLREWRLRQKPNVMDNLSLYLSIYREVLKAFKVIQSHNVTHYDIKCDNILIDFKSTNEQQRYGGGQRVQNYASQETPQQLSQDDFTITIGDFGTCHMYQSDKDEFLVSDRGTPNIKSPEMIELELNKRTDTDKYDRRKRVGTSRLSDVWSLGCLFYELLTGDMLFDADEFAWFFVRLTKTQLDLFQDGKLDKINNNVYLIDFLKYILVRDQRLRPTIDNVLKRFEHVYALLVATSSGHANNFTRLMPQDTEIYTKRGSKVTLQQMLQRAAQIMVQNSQTNGGASGSDAPLGPNAGTQKQIAMPRLMRIMEDVFISSVTWLSTSSAHVIRCGITHIVIPEHLVDNQVRDKFEIYAIPTHIEELPNKHGFPANPYSALPGIMDFLRRAALFKGRILFIESDSDWTAADASQRVQLVRECMLMSLAAIYQTSAYETYTLIKSQNLFFTVEASRLQTISEWTQLCASVNQYLASYPKFSCMCGSCVLILKRQYATYQSTQLVACQCQHYYKNLAGDMSGGCPSPGCADYISFLRTYYRQETEQRGLLPDNQLLWGFFEEEYFVVGPNFSGITDNYHQRQIAASISKTIDKNSTLVATTEKNRGNGNLHGGGGQHIGGSNTPGGNTDLISRSSATRRNYSRAGGSALGIQHTGQGFQRWKLYKCSHCQIWTYAYNEHESRYAILLNNRVKDQKLSRLGLLAGQDWPDPTSGQNESATVRVPILQNIKLKIPF